MNRIIAEMKRRLDGFREEMKNGDSITGCMTLAGRCAALEEMIEYIETLQKESVSDDLVKVAEDYANKHSVLLGFDCDSEPIQTGTDIKNAVIYGAEWQRKLDADLGSPAYERGFTNGREFERKNRKDLAKELELVKSWFDDIVEKSSRLTTGNVAHLGKNIRGFAGHYSEYVNDLIKEG